MDETDVKNLSPKQLWSVIQNAEQNILSSLSEEFGVEIDVDFPPSRDQLNVMLFEEIISKRKPKELSNLLKSEFNLSS